jgi:hypothetical protein
MAGMAKLPDAKATELLLEILFIFAVFLVILGGRFVVLLVVFLFFVFILVFIVRKDNQMDGVSLRHFQFDIAFRTRENLAFFDFVLIQINFGVALGTSCHD